MGEIVPDILLLVDRSGTILYANHAPDGFVLNEVAGTNVFELAAASTDELEDSLDTIFRTGTTRFRELRTRHPDGTDRWYAIHTGPVRSGGEIVAATIVARDVTEQKRSEAALREREACYRTLMEHAPEAVLVLDADHERFVEVNRNACLLFGMAREALMDRNPCTLSPFLQPDGELSSVAARRRIREALDGASPVFDWVHRRSDGTEILCEVRLVRMPAEGRSIVRGSVIDVTEKRRLEQSVLQAQKTEALGELASSVAHEFNNLLTVIFTSAGFIAQDLDSVPDLEALRRTEALDDVERIRLAAEHGAEVTRQLLNFARRGDAELRLMDVNCVVADVTKMVHRIMPDGVDLAVSLDPSGAHVRGRGSGLEQVIMNLVLNARDAMPFGGTITVKTCIVQDATVRIEVTDTGVGMDPTTLRRAFEPMFTTKPRGKGTGLGLPMVRKIVEELGGRVEATSIVGTGTRFELILPKADLESEGHPSR